MSEDELRRQIVGTVKAKADRQRAEEEEEAIRIHAENERRLANGRAIETVILKVIKPVLDAAGEQLCALGYKAKIQVIQEDVPRLAIPASCGIKIIMSSNSEKGVLDMDTNQLGYLGYFEAQSLARKLLIHGRTIEPGTAPMALDAISEDLVRRDVLQFINSALS